MKNHLLGLCIFCIAFLSACKKDSTEKIDTEYPTIDITNTNAFPKQCSTVKRGQKFMFRALLSDNASIGSVSVDIHHNFDQHTHSTEVESCNLDSKKSPIKPFLLIQVFNIPAGLKTYDLEQEITVPADIDAGDYHFMIRLTDKEGWQSIKGLSIKVID